MHAELTEKIIGAAFEVSNTLGHGFLESVYRRALLFELELLGVPAKEEVNFSVRYKGREIGRYLADLVVDERVIVEMKAVEGLTPAHVGQLLNYLHASNLRLGLLFNFGKPKLEFRRVAA